MLVSKGVTSSFPFRSGTAATPPESTRLMQWNPQNWPVAEDWRTLLDGFMAGKVGQQLGRFVCERLSAHAVIYPPQPFRALELTPLAQVRVVILGQDPYHGPSQAQGLAFSVAPGSKLPPSLYNIFREIMADPLLDLGQSARPRDGSLIDWARQGVLLLNTVLTVEAANPASHAKRGWEALTDLIIEVVCENPHPVVFLLWGAQAQAKAGLIDRCDPERRHLVLTANHPSPLSARRGPKPFLGCGHFGQTNAFLRQQGRSPVLW